MYYVLTSIFVLLLFIVLSSYIYLLNVFELAHSTLAPPVNGDAIQGSSAQVKDSMDTGSSPESVQDRSEDSNGLKAAEEKDQKTEQPKEEVGS